MTTDRVMLLIDADNVSVDVIEQAVANLLQTHGALHVRRAYCTGESAVKHQAVFKRLSIKPMVNLSTGKNSTDIALAVDAVDLVLAERPDVVAIASSDSDFAPLVGRLREKGCRVVGFGQEGKTGDETLLVYDEYTVLAHRKAQTEDAPRPARKTAARTARKTAAKPAAQAAEAKAPAKRAAPRRRAAAAVPEMPAPAAVQAPAAAPIPAPAPAPSAVAAVVLPMVPVAPELPERLRRILACLPELERGETLELRVVSVRLREAGLLGRSASSTKLLSGFADRFELLPAGQPNHVRLLRSDGGG
jgi:uncharacterized protein (TIGR00288 family)